MKPSHFLILLFLLGTLIPAKDLSREKPRDFISDPSSWLSRESQESLEAFLKTRSYLLSTDVYVLLEPPLRSSPEETRAALRTLGHSWSKVNWAIISYRPGQIGAPMIVSGGPFQEKIQSKFWEEELRILQDLSVQTWSDHPDIDFLARSLSDSLVFISRLHNSTQYALVQNWHKEEQQKRRERESSKIHLTIIIIGALLLLILGTFLIRSLYLKHRKMTFPETQWFPRLQAPHSGGSSINQRFQPPEE